MDSNGEGLAVKKIAYRVVDQAAATSLQEAGYYPLAARVLAARGVCDHKELSPDLASLPGLDDGAAATAASLFADAVKANKHICIIGDYDADGMCGTALAKLALDSMDIKTSWLLSSRSHVERGLDPSLVNQAHALGAQMLVTVDNGTNAFNGVARARELGMQVIITDHHLPDKNQIVSADAIANPRLPGSGLPTTNMCGTAVMLTIIREVFRQCGAKHRAGRYSDLAAVATMTDVMPLNDCFNRMLVLAGTEAIRKGRCRTVFKAMLAERRHSCQPRYLNFRLGAMLNAAQRMDKPELGVNALLADDITTARHAANELESLNRERRSLSDQTLEEAMATLGHEPVPALVIYQAHWNLSIVGLVASHLADRLGVPTAILCKHDNKLRGSLRGIPNVPVHTVLANIEREAPGLLGRWGGHELAAGIQLAGDLEEFRHRFTAHCSQYLKGHDQPPIWVDGNPDVEELTDGSVGQLQVMPWGNAFPQPQFVGTFTIEESRPTMKGNGFLYKLALQDEVFNGWNRVPIGKTGETLDIVYTAASDNFNPKQPFILPSGH